MSETTFDYSLSCAEFVRRARPIRDAYRAGEITYTQMRRELERIQPKPVRTVRQQCRGALSALKRAREKAIASLWYQHESLVSAARRDIECIEHPVWRARMTRAADSIAAMARRLEDPR